MNLSIPEVYVSIGSNCIYVKNYTKDVEYPSINMIKMEIQHIKQGYLFLIQQQNLKKPKTQKKPKKL